MTRWSFAAKRRTGALLTGAALALSACAGATETSTTAVPEPAATEVPVEAAPAISINAVTTLGDAIDLVPANQETLLWFWAPW